MNKRRGNKNRKRRRKSVYPYPSCSSCKNPGEGSQLRCRGRRCNSYNYFWTIGKRLFCVLLRHCFYSSPQPSYLFAVIFTTTTNNSKPLFRRGKQALRSLSHTFKNYTHTFTRLDSRTKDNSPLTRTRTSVLTAVLCLLALLLLVSTVSTGFGNVIRVLISSVTLSLTTTSFSSHEVGPTCSTNPCRSSSCDLLYQKQRHVEDDHFQQQRGRRTRRTSTTTIFFVSGTRTTSAVIEERTTTTAVDDDSTSTATSDVQRELILADSSASGSEGPFPLMGRQVVFHEVVAEVAQHRGAPSDVEVTTSSHRTSKTGSGGSGGDESSDEGSRKVQRGSATLSFSPSSFLQNVVQHEPGLIDVESKDIYSPPSSKPSSSRSSSTAAEAARSPPGLEVVPGRTDVGNFPFRASRKQKGTTDSGNSAASATAADEEVDLAVLERTPSVVVLGSTGEKHDFSGPGASSALEVTVEQHQRMVTQKLQLLNERLAKSAYFVRRRAQRGRKRMRQLQENNQSARQSESRTSAAQAQFLTKAGQHDPLTRAGASSFAASASGGGGPRSTSSFSEKNKNLLGEESSNVGPPSSVLEKVRHKKTKLSLTKTGKTKVGEKKESMKDGGDPFLAMTSTAMEIINEHLDPASGSPDPFTFDNLDLDHDGQISLAEMNSELFSSEHEDTARDIVAWLDKSDDSDISQEEFEAQFPKGITTEALQKMYTEDLGFDDMDASVLDQIGNQAAAASNPDQYSFGTLAGAPDQDTDLNDDYISPAEFTEKLFGGTSDDINSKAQGLITWLDTSKDGKVSHQEFLAAFPEGRITQENVKDALRHQFFQHIQEQFPDGAFDPDKDPPIDDTKMNPIQQSALVDMINDHLSQFDPPGEVHGQNTIENRDLSNAEETWNPNESYNTDD
ncbi:unnamed protein product [Amoebophrya sp. A120]|nr:unnamed protein product [Amoebophrya sp. A120]|eukprot:GSA120T00022237001.1